MLMIMQIAAIIALLLPLFCTQLDAGYFGLLRLFIFGLSVFLAYQFHNFERKNWLWLFGFTAFTFNPIAQIHLTRNAWSFVDVAAAALFYSSIFAIRKMALRSAAVVASFLFAGVVVVAIVANTATPAITKSTSAPSAPPPSLSNQPQAATTVANSELIPAYTEPSVPKGYWTIGSSQDRVLKAQGDPSSIIGRTWRYEFSTVRFDSDGHVEEYSNISNNLKVTLTGSNLTAQENTLLAPPPIALPTQVPRVPVPPPAPMAQADAITRGAPVLQEDDASSAPSGAVNAETTQDAENHARQNESSGSSQLANTVSESPN